jgi:hypothetical protein
MRLEFARKLVEDIDVRLREFPKNMIPRSLRNQHTSRTGVLQ